MGVLKRRGLPRLAGIGLALAGLALAALLAVLLARGGDETASAFSVTRLAGGAPGVAGVVVAPDFSIGVNTDNNTGTGDQRPSSSAGTPAPRGDDCVSVHKDITPTPPPTVAAPAKCGVPPSAGFAVSFYLNSLGGVTAYSGYDLNLVYTGVAFKSLDKSPAGGNWPDCGLPVASQPTGTATPSGTILNGGCTESGTPSTYIGRLATVHFNCTADGTIKLVHGSTNTDIIELKATPPYNTFYETSAVSESITINCNAPTLVPTSSPTPTSTPTNTPTNTPTVTNTPLFSPTPNTATPTQTSFPEISIRAQGTRVTCDTPTPPSTKPGRCQAPVEATPKNGEFQIVVDANHVPAGYGGFNSDVLFGGLDLNSRSCPEEVVWPGAYLCQQTLGAAVAPALPASKQHKSRTASFAPFPLSTYIGPLVRINTHCPREGQFKVVLPAYSTTPARPAGAAFYNANDTPIAVVTVGLEPLDANGDGVADTTPSFPLAGALLINCLVIPTLTPTQTPTVTPTATATPCSGPCPTAAATRTPTATNTVPPANTVPPTNTLTPTRTATPVLKCCPTPFNLTVPGKATTDPAGHGATSSEPVQVSITTTQAGEVTILEKSIVLPDPTGATLFGQQVNISAPQASAQRPLSIVFWLDASIIPAAANQNTIKIYKSGVLVPSCRGAPNTASPDPCVSTRTLLTASQAGDVQIQVLTSASASTAWNFGTGGGVLGDVNCEGLVNAIDGELILQFGAAIIGSLPCQGNADVNHDALIDPRDALLILQLDAGLVSALPSGASAGLSVWSGFAGLARWLEE
jgi:hypothetical protein